jgi:hypothetical protein
MIAVYHNACFPSGDHAGKQIVSCPAPPFVDGRNCAKCGVTLKTGNAVKWFKAEKGAAAAAPASSSPSPAATTPEPAAPVPAIPANVPGEIGALISMFVGPFVDQRIAAKLDMSKLAQTLTEKVLESIDRPVTIEVKPPNDDVAMNVGVQHRQFKELLTCMAARIPVYMVGGPGTGKTHAAETAAQALGLECEGCGTLGTAEQVTGYNSAAGTYVETAFTRRFEHGGVFIGDELDGWLPDAAIALNAALANGWCQFPHKRIAKHKDFVFVGCANTWGTGATAEFVGRSRQDAAFLDRFAFLDWALDEALEDHLCPDKSWLRYVRKCRTNATKTGAKVIISPRASIIGARLLAAGMDRDRVVDLVLKKNMAAETWARVST